MIKMLAFVLATAPAAREGWFVPDEVKASAGTFAHDDMISTAKVGHRPRLVCRWAVDAETGALVARWSADEAPDGAREAPRRTPLRPAPRRAAAALPLPAAQPALCPA